ncbi:cellulose biosynthesis protein BcsS [Methylocystis sp. ATCC 49242]|uniref:cellulose biosynthesis protein BcsS n=1 Tax=Methylocystis sp. ATCC 49242 TaxID=622637 RepID=UPI0001F87A1F|nr:cellulose biosynthesis protein BcsS [Methylocystis sp. ATCC 49242]
MSSHSRMLARFLPAIGLLTSIPPAFSQSPSDIFQGPVNGRTEAPKSKPRLEIYNWLYGSSRRAWYEWLTVTASLNSSLDESGFRSRVMGAVGGYAIDIPGSEAEILSASGYEQNDILPLMGTVGKLYGMNAFGGFQFGYTYQHDRGKLSGFVGMAVVKDWANSSNLIASTIRHSVDAATFNVSRLGVLGSLEGEFYPTDQTMISGWAIYTPAYNWGYFEARAGVLVPFRNLLPRSLAENAYIGPHVALSMTDGVRQPMFGAHLSGLNIGNIHLNYTVGYAREFAGSGVYSILETTLQF